MKLFIYAVGRLTGPERELAETYEKRLREDMHVREFQTGTPEQEAKNLLAALPDKTFLVLLDETGRDLSSAEFAEKMTFWRETGPQNLVFVIGGPDGLTQEIKARAQFLLGLGRKTWPHKLVRIMLFEQLYRAQQITAGHPYHRA